MQKILRNMRKNKIRLNESTLRNIVRESIIRMLYEGKKSQSRFLDDDGEGEYAQDFHIDSHKVLPDHTGAINHSGDSFVGECPWSEDEQDEYKRRKKEGWLNESIKRTLRRVLSEQDDNLVGTDDEEDYSDFGLEPDADTKALQSDSDWDSIDYASNVMDGTYNYDGDEDIYNMYGDNSTDDGGERSMYAQEYPEEAEYDDNGNVPQGFNGFEEYGSDDPQKLLDLYRN